jgi:hypothetical protein
LQKQGCIIFFTKILKNETYLKNCWSLKDRWWWEMRGGNGSLASLKNQTHTNELHHKTNKKEQWVPLRVRWWIREKKPGKKKTEKKGKKRGIFFLKIREEEKKARKKKEENKCDKINIYEFSFSKFTQIPIVLELGFIQMKFSPIGALAGVRLHCLWNQTQMKKFIAERETIPAHRGERPRH